MTTRTHLQREAAEIRAEVIHLVRRLEPLERDATGLARSTLLGVLGRLDGIDTSLATLMADEDRERTG